jgi:hypothetical protein
MRFAFGIPAHLNPACLQFVAPSIQDKAIQGLAGLAQAREIASRLGLLAQPVPLSCQPPAPKQPPNPSLEGTRTGMALGPRGRAVYHRPRGPSTIPPRAPQLNVRPQRVRLVFRSRRSAAMGREVTASSGSRCPVASDASVRFVRALGPAPARSDESTLVVRYPSNSVPGRQPKAPCDPACHVPNRGILLGNH